MKSIALLALSILTVSGQDVSARFEKEGVVEDVLTVAPKELLEVRYEEQEVSAELGNTLAVSKTGSQPLVRYSEASSRKMYTLAMVDPDAPNRADPKAAQWLHWLVVNIPGEDLSGGDVSLGKVLMQHNGPSPPQGSGPHRYVFLVYEQTRSVRSRVSRNRAGFDIEKWTSSRSNNLGSPVAGNFYFAEN